MSERGRYVGLGCLMTVAGFFSGGMIGALVAKLVGMARGCTPMAGTPACDWHVYLLVGGLAGALTLPWLTINAVRRSGADEQNPDRG